MDLDTNNDLFPEGTFRFRVSEVPESGETKGGYSFFKFSFTTDIEGSEQSYSERIMRWMMAPICRALDFEEYKPGKFHFEPTECVGREVEATIRHEKIEKGANMGQVVARMKDIRPVGVAGRVSANRGAFNAQAPASQATEDIPF